jgi:DNA-binding XRE family transcriptional regulator
MHVTYVTYRSARSIRYCWALKLKASVEFSERFAAAIKQRRKAVGLSHEKLSKLSGVSRSAISMIESGSRSASLVTCHALAAALGTTVSRVASEAEALGTGRR